MAITRDGYNTLRKDSTILGTLHFGSPDNVTFRPAPDIRLGHKILADICRFIEPMTAQLFQRNPVDGTATRFEKASGNIAANVFRGVIADDDHLIGSITSDALFKAAPGITFPLRELVMITRTAKEIAEGKAIGHSN